ncbi:hypothetical protein NPIL_653051 [Nephila pilipes]|uniref:Uncharacterized protein n=1 Tax=Nephila pilipes TaxID=299642 RepID=A0A8X6UIP4_NEPPI|nr:hypothetical protein NPIL_653051 [Nephila pilipes]
MNCENFFEFDSLALHCDNSYHTSSLSHYSGQPIESLDSNLKKPIAKRALASTEETLHRLEAAQVKTLSSSVPATLSSNGIEASVCLPTWNGK